LTFIGHMAAGYILGNTFHACGLPVESIVITTAASAAPDIDGLIYFAKKGKITIGDDFAHHTWITHKPIFWLLLSIAAFFGIRLAGLVLPAQYLYLFLAGVLSHFILDCFATTDGIQWLWPVSQKWTIITKIEASKGEWLGKYLKHKYLRVEIAIVTVAIGLIILNIVT